MITVCYSTCWACKFDSHYDTPTVHTWMDPDDIECHSDAGRLRSLTRNELATEKPCACRCGGGRGGCQIL